MTDPSESTTSTPAATGPTPEEISARLEALLKRTQALRAAQRTVPDQSGPLPWPPPDGELDALELVDVPHMNERRPEPEPSVDAPVREGDGQPGAPSAPATEPVRSFERPDWTSLRLREPQPAPSHTPGWLWLLVAGLVVALGLETAYLLQTAPWASPGAAAPVASLSLEGDARLRARVDDGEPETLPLRRDVQPGTEARVVIELTEPADTDASGAVVGGQPAPAGAAVGRGPTGIQPVRSASTGSVLIESSPPGALVTMEGRERGRTPIRIDGLRPGRHDVLVAGTSGILALKVDVVAGETARLDVSRP